MNIPITINIPEELYQRAKRFAHLANRDIESVITDTMLSSLRWGNISMRFSPLGRSLMRKSLN
jgi:hypothetical protein